MANPPASPSDRPSRPASNGRHGVADTSPSELKPNSTLPHSVSTPPTSAASAAPAPISRAACANTLALDEQAVATVMQGPPRPVRSEEHTSEPQSLMRLSYAVLCLKKKKRRTAHATH